MGRVEIQGIVPTIIITQLDRISIKRVLSAPITASTYDSQTPLQFSLFDAGLKTDRGVYCWGTLLGKIDGEEHEAAYLEFPQGYLIHAHGTPTGMRPSDYPMYVIPSGVALDNYYDWYTYPENGNEDIRLIDNTLVLHNPEIKLISWIDCNGEITARRDLSYKGASEIFLDFTPKRCYACTMNFDGRLGFQRGMSGDLMELDGTFKLKPREAEVKREGEEPYRVQGNWEAVLKGHVVAEVDNPAVLRAEKLLDRRRVTPSFVKIRAEGQLVI